MRPALAAGGLFVLLAVSSIVGGPSGLLLAHAVVLCLVLAVLLSEPRITSVRGLPQNLWIAFGLFGVLVLVGFANAAYTYAAWLTLLELSAFTAVVWLAARGGPALLPSLTVPSVLLVCAVSLVVLFHELTGGPQSMLGFVNPNHLAGWLVALSLAVGPSFYTRFARNGRRRWILALFVVPPVPLALAAAGSRGAFVGLLVGLVTLFAFRMRHLTRKARRALLVVAALLLMVTGAGLVERVRRPDAFSYQRVEIWTASLRMIAERPWLGTGPRQFAQAAGNFQFPDGYGPLHFDRRFSRTHSDLLRVPAEFGVPASLALLAALLLGLQGAARVRSVEPTQPVRSGAAAALAAMAAHCAVDNLSETPAVYLLGAVLFGSLMSIPRPPARSPSVPARISLALLLVVVFAVGDLSPYLAWREIDGLPRGRLDDAGEKRLGRAIRLNRLQPDYRRRLAEHIYGDEENWTPALYAEAREAAEHAVRLDPKGAAYRLGVARVEAQACRSLFSGDPATALRSAAAYDQAAALDRYNGVIRLEQAGGLLDCGAVKLAISAAEKSIEIEPESVAPRLLLAGALLADEEPDVQRARQLLERAETLARQHREWRGQSPVAARMLTLDSRLVERVRLAIESVDVAQAP